MSSFPIKLETGDKFWTPEGLGAMGMDPNRAIAELVANSLDWRREDINKSIINIKIGAGFIEIIDNGVGMTVGELTNAIKVSVSNDDIRKNLRIRKGMFGMGMKVACLTLGWKITIVTKSINEKEIENTLILDTRNFEKDPNYREKIEGHSNKTKNESSPLSKFESGTSIRIDDLTYKKMLGISIRDSLQEAFKPEISLENIEINVYDKNRDESFKCQKIETSILEGTRIDLDELELYVQEKDSQNLKKIKGWVGLMTISRPSGEWGLHLFKNKQIIERFHQLPTRLGGLMPKNPHAEFSRTYGEIELEMCAPAFHKVGFDYSTSEWEQVQKLLAPILTDLMEASRTYKKSDAEKADEAIKKIQKRRRASKKAADRLKEFIDDENKPEDAITLPDGRWFTIVDPIFKELQEDDVPWIYNFTKASKELLIIINTKCPIYKDVEIKKFEENLMYNIINWSISECMYFLLIDEFHYNDKEALNFRNIQLSKLYKI